MLARGPTAEVFPRDKDRGLGVARRVQHKIGNLFSVARKAPVVEQEFPESRALDALQKLLGNDLIGVHVHLIKRDNDAGMLAKRLHNLVYLLWKRGFAPLGRGKAPSPHGAIEIANFECQ